MKSEKTAERTRTAVAYVQLVYGRQLQQPADETPPADVLDVRAMSREERAAWKRRILERRPELAELELERDAG